MHSTFERYMTIVALGTQLLLNCIIMPFHSHGTFRGGDELHYSQSVDSGSHHSILSSHHGECTVCHTYRDLTAELPMFSIVQQDTFAVLIQLVGLSVRCSSERSSATLRGPPQSLS
jgi:hypothetical protein